MSTKSNHPSPYDLMEREQAVTEAEDAEGKARRARQVEDIKWLMGHPQGRRIATRLLKLTGVRRTTFNPSGSVMAFAEGQRNVGLWFESELISANPEGYLKLLREFANE